MHQPYIYFEDQLGSAKKWARRLYSDPVDIVKAYRPEDIPAALGKLQAYHSQGLYLAGYFSYELGYLFEAKLNNLMPTEQSHPLLAFGIFKSYGAEPLPSVKGGRLSPLSPDWSEQEYIEKYDRVQAYLQAGDVYQINLTFPMTGRYRGDPIGLYQFLKNRQPVHYGGIVNLDDSPILTFSPELFYERIDNRIQMRPMKGTIKRGTNDCEDRALAGQLQSDTKNRAENLMIVDLLRNDLARLSKPGSVKVSDLFSVETYPSLHTMTSGIEAVLKPDTSLHDILKALFPCGSVTGAPKIRAMEVIAELESRPRGPYCGAIGMIDPDGHSRFNVGIRTLLLSAGGHLTYPVGSGIVSDSSGEMEYAECLLKAAFLTDGNFELIETLGWDTQTGFMHLDLHLGRLAASAFAFGFAFAENEVRTALSHAVNNLKRPQRVKLTLANDGSIEVICTPLKIGSMEKPWRISLSKNPLPSSDPLRAHKTTKRAFYDGERERISNLTRCEEVLFFNEKDELCEGSFTNVFVKMGPRMFTPPKSAGLLPGILRHVLLNNGDVFEKYLNREDLLRADEIWIGNSLRGLIRAQLIDGQLI